MADFTRKPPATVTEDGSIDDALEDMVVAGVHALLVAVQKALLRYDPVPECSL
jgi:CBS domain-containing protein